MHSRKRAFLAGAILALAIAAPASAKTPLRAETIRDQIDRLDDDIDRADNTDVISEREAADLRRRLNELQEDFRRANANGLTRGEMNNLSNRIDNIRRSLKLEKIDWGGGVG